MIQLNDWILLLKGSTHSSSMNMRSKSKDMADATNRASKLNMIQGEPTKHMRATRTHKHSGVALLIAPEKHFLSTSTRSTRILLRCTVQIPVVASDLCYFDNLALFRHPLRETLRKYIFCPARHGPRESAPPYAATSGFGLRSRSLRQPRFVHKASPKCVPEGQFLSTSKLSSIICELD